MMDFLITSTISLSVFLLVYWYFLKSEKLFSFLRIYLLGAIIFSLVLPLIHIPVSAELVIPKVIESGAATIGGDQFLHAESSKVASKSASTPDWKMILFGIYLTGVSAMMVRFTINYLKIQSIYREGTKVNKEEYLLVIHPSVEQPFSFFRSLFLQSPEQANNPYLIDHELTHIRQQHSWDIIIVELLMVFLWFQPLLYIYRKQVALNHEYQADAYTFSANGKAFDYLYQIIGIPNHHSAISLACNFSFISFKNRINMMLKKPSSTNIIVLKTLLVVVVALGLLSTACETSTNIETVDPFVVVVDAGHGGIDWGVHTATGLQEKAITLSMAKELTRLLESNDGIEVRLTRSDDVFPTLEERVVSSEGADLVVSLHIDDHPNNNELNHLSVYFSDENSEFERSSNIASQMSQSFNDSGFEMRISEANFIILRKPKCPSVLVNLGFLSNEGNVDFIQSEEGKERFAKVLESTILSVAMRN